MRLFARFFCTEEPEPLTQAQEDQEVIETLQAFGPMIQRHVRQHVGMGVQGTEATLSRLEQQGLVERYSTDDPDYGVSVFFRLKGGR